MVEEVEVEEVAAAAPSAVTSPSAPDVRVEKFADYRPDRPLPSPVNRHIVELLRAVTDPKRLAQMNPTWHPWF